MPPSLPALLADAVLVLHVGVVAFVVVGTLAILVGGPLGWRPVRSFALRATHLVVMLLIALQAWLGRLCPLTDWERALRIRAGQDTYDGSFIQHWLSRLIFVEAPWWVFVLAYTAFAAIVLACWWRWPPLRGQAQAGREA